MKHLGNFNGYATHIYGIYVSVCVCYGTCGEDYRFELPKDPHGRTGALECLSHHFQLQ